MRLPWIDMELPTQNDVSHYFNFENMNDQIPRQLYEFPEGTVFGFMAWVTGQSTIKFQKQSGGEDPNIFWYNDARTLELVFTREDTSDIVRDTDYNILLEAVFPDERRRSLFEGRLTVRYIRRPV